MGTTLWESAVQSTVDEFCKRDPRAYPVLADIRDRLKSGFYPSEIVDFVGQHSWHTSQISVQDAYCFAQIWTAYMTGSICIFEIPYAKDLAAYGTWIP